MKLSDAELLAAIEAEESLALDTQSSELQRQRADALDRYLGRPDGKEVEGRSQVVDKSIADTIEWIMPSLVRIYMGGEDIGEFHAYGPEDEDGAQRETEVCNWYLTERNDYFSQIVATLKDALLLKNGYAVAYWKVKEDTTTEVYKGLADEEVALLMQDKEVEVLEHTGYPDPETGMPLHDVRVKMKKADEFVAVESVPPDEMIVSRRQRWTSLLEADFVQWRRRVSIGQLRADGFDVPDDAPGYTDQSPEWSSRARFEENSATDDETPDPARRIVEMRDTYMRIDLRGKGVPQLWRVCHIAGHDKILLKDEADIIPIAAFSPIIYPHSHVGISVYDLLCDLGEIRTALQRQYLDGVYLANSNQYVVDINRVNIDDFLVSRPGGIKRIEGPVDGAVMPLIPNDTGPSILGGLEYIDRVKEERTGVTRYSAGLDANTLNKTATGVQAIQSAANQRIELIARTLASGFRDLFLIIHALASKHSTKPLQLKLRNNWVVVNPREWKKRTDFRISVGLGTGNPEQQIQKLMALGQFMMTGQAMGLVSTEEMYNYGKELLKAFGYRNPNKFLKEPQRGPDGNVVPPPPKPDPLVQAEMAKAQGQMPIKQMEIQADAAKMHEQHAFEMQKLREQLASNERIAAMNNAAKHELELARMAEERALQLHVSGTEMEHKGKVLDLEKSRLQMDAVKHASTLEQKDRQLAGVEQ